MDTNHLASLLTAYNLVNVIYLTITLVLLDCFYFKKDGFEAIGRALQNAANKRNPNYLVTPIIRMLYDLLGKFMGKDVGIAGDPDNRGKSKWHGWYIAYLFLFYYTIGGLSVIAFPPLDIPNPAPNTLYKGLGFVAWIAVNVAGDVISCLMTRKYFGQILCKRDVIVTKEAVICLIKIFTIALTCMLSVQLITNGLYSIQIGYPERFFEYMSTWDIALRHYGPTANGRVLAEFPGMLIISTASFIPTYIVTLLAMIIYLPAGLLRLLPSQMRISVLKGIENRGREIATNRSNGFVSILYANILIIVSACHPAITIICQFNIINCV
jgi:hypothetical protein